MAVVDVKVFNLEILTPCRRAVSALRDGLSVIHARRPTVAYYRFLYNTVSQDYHCFSRGRLSDLAATVQNPLNEVQLLHVQGTPAGFDELDRRKEDEIELVQFGLMPEFIGQGLGQYFLQGNINKAWSYRPRWFWPRT